MHLTHPMHPPHPTHPTHPMHPMHPMHLMHLLVALFLSACAQAPPEQQFVNDAMEAIGGRSRVEVVKTLTLEGEGVNYNLGQDMAPEAATQQFAVSNYKRQIDIANGRQRVEQTRTPKFAYFQGPQPQTQIQGLDGVVAFNVNAQGQPFRVAPLAETDRLHDIYHHPLKLLRSTMDPKTTVTNVRSAGTTRQAEITTAAGPVLTLTIDAAGVPLSISSKAHHANLGDVVMTTVLGQYEDVSGLRLPTRFGSRVDDFTTAEIRITRQAIDGDVGDLAAPATVAGARPAAAPINVTAEPAGKGVWLMGGGSHHSALIEFSDHLMLIDAPQSEARTLAVIAKAKQTVPNKPLTQLVTTHHHFDHTAGLRAAIAEGMNVITHTGNEAWVERMARRPHTVQPDTLTKTPTRLVVETVEADKQYSDPSMTVQLFHVAGNPHSDTMLMAYIPQERVLIQADAYSPGAGPHIYAANLLENIQKRNLRVDRIVPLHGTIGSMADMVKAVGDPPKEK
jgi:glyoxylase-like metal-dependent hydrolase (beta-lactamase superfamily II)